MGKGRRTSLSDSTPWPSRLRLREAGTGFDGFDHDDGGPVSGAVRWRLSRAECVGVAGTFERCGRGPRLGGRLGGRATDESREPEREPARERRPRWASGTAFAARAATRVRSIDGVGARDGFAARSAASPCSSSGSSSAVPYSSANSRRRSTSACPGTAGCPSSLTVCSGCA
jgi:hypothetical protein